MEMIDRNGSGYFYMQQEGRGIGLRINWEFHRLQEDGRDTVEANLDLGRRWISGTGVGA